MEFRKFYVRIASYVGKSTKITCQNKEGNKNLKCVITIICRLAKLT